MVDVVGDQHEVTDFEVGVHAARGVADEERVDAQLVHGADGERHLGHGVALVVVEAAVERHDGLAAEASEEQASLMAFDGGHGEMGHVGIGERVDDVDLRGKVAEARAEDDGDVWT